MTYYSEHKEQATKYYEDNKEKIREYSKTYYEKNKERILKRQKVINERLKQERNKGKIKRDYEPYAEVVKNNHAERGRNGK